MNNANKKNRLMLRKTFSKDELKMYKKFRWIMTYNIPYAMMVRAYRRYLKNIEQYIIEKGYPSYWFSKDKRTFSNAVKLYIESNFNNYIYSEGTRGYTQIEIVKVSWLDKYLI